MPLFPLEALRLKNPKPRIHFIGIGGVHMSAMARMLYLDGFPVSGNDRDESDNVKALRDLGLQVSIGHKPEYVEHADLVIRNAAIHDDSPDVRRTRELGLPMYERPEVLGAMMRTYPQRLCIAGTHGKSTTTAMCSSIVTLAGADPTVFCGAKLSETDTAYRFGAKEFFIAEACEYCNSFLSFYPTHACILNVEEDHLDFFSGIGEIRSSFLTYAGLVPTEGTVVCQGDDPALRKLLGLCPRRVVWFGEGENCDYRAVDITEKDGCYSFTVSRKSGVSYPISLVIPGKHNVQDALAAFAMTVESGIAPEVACEALSHFTGACRRFEIIGEYNGALLVDDFAHHPTELEATLRTALSLGKKRVICLFQPHTFSRTKALCEEFSKALSLADVPVLLPIYPAREVDTGEVTSAMIGEKVPDVFYAKSFDDAERLLQEEISPTGEDILLVCGAGSIAALARRLREKEAPSLS